MILDIQFVESNQSFDCKFGEVNNVSDGGYERGYEKGYEDGFDDGFDDAYKEEQEKSINITENSTTEVTPDEDMVLSKVIVKVDVPDKSEEIGVIIDQSGVLDSTEGTATEKVEQLIDKAEDENLWYQATTDTKKIGSFFSDSTIERLPRINFSVLTSLSYAFQRANLKRIDVYMDTQNCTNFNSTFMRCIQLEYVKGINLSSATFVNSCFAKCTALKTIEEPIDYSYLSVNSTESNINMFGDATALETIRIVPESIKKHFLLAHTSVLTAESIQSIIDGLAYVETAQKLTLHTNVVAKLTEEQYNTIFEKNWNIG